MELETVLEALRRFPDGSGVEGLLRSGNLRLSRRTLQRRLFQLNKSGRVSTEGGGAGCGILPLLLLLKN